MTYEAAYKELQAITSAIQNEQISVDVLAEKVKRASELISFCQDKLRTTEQQVGEVVRKMGGTSNPNM